MSRMLSLAALFAVSVLAIRPVQACPWCKSPYAPGKYTGEAQIVGNGVAYSWVILDDKGKPSSLGITLTANALNGLPATPPVGMVGTEYTLKMPKQAKKSGFDHVGLDWNPMGHFPAGIYDMPHFDAHFYMISTDTRSKITAKGDDLARCSKKMPADYVAPGYIYAPGGEEPGMGAHWVNTNAPEFKGKPFTTTFLYGSYDGKMIFAEPMVTKEFIETRPDYTETIPVPARYSSSGYYPTRYCVRFDAARQEYTLSMEGLTWREAPKGQTPPAGIATGKAKSKKVAVR